MLKRTSIYLSALLVPALFLISISASAQSACSMLGPNSQNVHDYNDPNEKTLLGMVNKAHFGAEMQRLQRGTSGGLIGPDLTYTLDVFPNHFLALDVASRLSIKLNTPKPPGARCSVDGWFERAIEFKSDDARVRMVYGMHLNRQKKIDKAIEQFEIADKLAPNDANLAYNLGLLYFDLGKYDKAMAFAEKAYGADFPLEGLKNKLVKAGKWVEPKAVTPKSEVTKPDQPQASDSPSVQSK